MAEQETETPKRKVVIDRQKWCRRKADKSYHLEHQYPYKLRPGVPINAGSKLLTSQGGMCCLGFLSKQILGCADGDILGVNFPDRELLDKFGLGSLNALKCAQLNDCPSYPFEAMSDADQEAAIAAEFAKAGLETEFIN